MMFCDRKINIVLAVVISLMALTACHPKVEPVSSMDRELSCAALSSEIQNVRDVRARIEKKRGFSGRNVGLGLIFWPGIVINEVTGSDAESDANARLASLQNIYADKKCSLEKAAETAANEKTEAKKG